jgi:hypothetical protein
VNTRARHGLHRSEAHRHPGALWGGYQITHLITRTNIFAAVQAGASVSNMISAYGGIRWGTGMSRAFQYEKTQSRIGAPPWDAPLQFIENSPIFWVEKVQTPYLTIHNDEDDAVPWYQGIEFFTALRRLGKEAYMFNYNGELHGLRNRDNQKHWTVHQDEFFDHYLLGKPRPEWMDKGVPFLERGKRDVSRCSRERAGILEDYILVASTDRPSATAGTTGTTPPAATGTTGAAVMKHKAFKLEHADDEKLQTLVGKMVEVTGKVDAEARDARAPGAPTADRSMGPDQIELPEFEVTSIKEVPGDCPAKPDIKK